MSLPDQIDELCDAWAEQWQLQSCPDLQGFLAATQPELLKAVLPVLVPMDFNLRRLKNPALRSGDYAWLGEEGLAIAERCATRTSVVEPSDKDRRDSPQQRSALWKFQSDAGDSFPPDPGDDSTMPELKDFPSDVGEFRVVELIGGGGQGIVAKAVHRGTKQVAAIKFIRPELAASLPVRRRFLQESSIARSIRHPYVVQFLSVEEKPQLCIVMEFVTGRTLESLIREHGPLTLQQIVRFGIQIADGLQAVHLANIVHRDLKPMNILLQTNGQMTAKISDFGVARSASDPRITRSGTIVGSAAWLSPEQALEKKVSGQSDLFSLGSILYCMACGQSPFQRPTLMATLNAVVGDVAVGMQAIRPELPDKLSRLVQDLLQKAPGLRPSSAAEVANGLRSIAEQSGIEDPSSEIAGSESDTNVLHSGQFRRRALLATMAAATCTVLFKSSRRLWPRDSDNNPKEQPRGEHSGNQRSPDQKTQANMPTAMVLPSTPFEVSERQAMWAKHLAVPAAFELLEGLRFTLIPPIQLSMPQQHELSEKLQQLQNITGTTRFAESRNRDLQKQTSPFFAAVRPVSWRQYKTLIDGPLAGALLAELSAAGQDKASGYPAVDATAELSWDQTTELLRRLHQRSVEKELLANASRTQAVNGQLTVGLPEPLEWLLLARALRSTNDRTSAMGDFRRQILLASQSAVVSGLNSAVAISEVPCLFNQDSFTGTVVGWIDARSDYSAESSVFTGHMNPPAEGTMNVRCSWERLSKTANLIEAAIWPIVRIPGATGKS